jgi:hypothetical protein
MQLMNISEAIACLDAYIAAISVLSQSCEAMSSLGAKEADAVEKAIDVLKAKIKELYVLSIIIQEEVTRQSEQLMDLDLRGFVDLVRSFNRRDAVIKQATSTVSKFDRVRNVPNTALADAIEEFRKKRTGEKF